MLTNGDMVWFTEERGAEERQWLIDVTQIAAVAEPWRDTALPVGNDDPPFKFKQQGVNFYRDPTKKLACVPFLRNLVEYTEGEGDAKFTTLTSILHWRADSAAITVKDLDGIFNEVCHGTSKSDDQNKAISDLVAEQADQCLGAPVGTNFENKIVLAIAI